MMSGFLLPVVRRRREAESRSEKLACPLSRERQVSLVAFVARGGGARTRACRVETTRGESCRARPSTHRESRGALLRALALFRRLLSMDPLVDLVDAVVHHLQRFREFIQAQSDGLDHVLDLTAHQRKISDAGTVMDGAFEVCFGTLMSCGLKILLGAAHPQVYDVRHQYLHFPLEAAPGSHYRGSDPATAPLAKSSAHDGKPGPCLRPVAKLRWIQYTPKLRSSYPIILYSSGFLRPDRLQRPRKRPTLAPLGT